VKCKVAEEATAAAGAGGGGSNGKSASRSKKGSGSSGNKEDGTGKKEYNHHARAHFDRAKAFALKVSVCNWVTCAHICAPTACVHGLPFLLYVCMP
jgi:hypothetical protein